MNIDVEFVTREELQEAMQMIDERFRVLEAPPVPVLVSGLDANLSALIQWCDKANWTLGGDEDAVRRQSMILDHIRTLVTRWQQGGRIEPPATDEVVR